MHFTWKHLQCTRGCITVLGGIGLCPMSRVDIGEQNTTGVRESHTASICKLLEEYGGRERLLTA